MHFAWMRCNRVVTCKTEPAINRKPNRITAHNATSNPGGIHRRTTARIRFTPWCGCRARRAIGLKKAFKSSCQGRREAHSVPQHKTEHEAKAGGTPPLLTCRPPQTHAACTHLPSSDAGVPLQALAITHASLWHAMKATSAGSGCFPADGRQLPLSIVSCSIQD